MSPDPNSNRMGDARFKRNLKAVAIVHFAVVLVLICSSFCRSLLERRKPIEIPVEFTVEYPRESQRQDARQPTVPPPQVESPAPRPRQITPNKNEPRIAPEPVPKPKPKPQPKPQPQPQERPKVASPTIVRERKVEPQRPALSEEEIKRLLEKGARFSDVTRIPVSDDALFREMIRRAFYDAWNQPSKAEAGDATAEIELRFGPGGSILSHKMVKSSGNPAFDASVLEAVARVERIAGLSADFLVRNPEVRVAFRVE